MADASATPAPRKRHSVDAAKSAGCFDAAGDAFSIDRFAACLGSGTAVGAVRASVGLANDFADIARAIDVVSSFCD